MWYKAVDRSGTWKPHVLSKALGLALADDLRSRNPDTDLTDAEAPSSVLLDAPGMILIDRAIRTIDIDGLAIKIPSTDWDYIFSTLSLTRRRYFDSNIPYYKVHTNSLCLVLTPEQRQALLKEMQIQYSVAAVEGSADNKRFQDAINAINKDKTQIVSARVEAMNASDKGIKGSN